MSSDIFVEDFFLPAVKSSYDLLRFLDVSFLLLIIISLQIEVKMSKYTKQK